MSDSREKPSIKSGSSCLIEIAHKRGVKDLLAAQVAAELRGVGEEHIPPISTARLYRLEGKVTREESERIGRELLADPVVEEAHFETDAPPSTARPRAARRGFHVDIWFKPGVTDVVGESVLQGLKDMRVDRVRDVRTGTRYRFAGIKNSKVAEKLAREVLFNPLIHERVIHAD